jgi:hypothetical protein
MTQLTVPFSLPLKNLHPETVVSKIDSIIIPQGQEWGKPGKEIQSLFNDLTGHQPEISNDFSNQLSSLRSGHKILLGTVHNNNTIAALYRRKYTLVDDAYPGKNSWVLQSVHNPEDLGHNAIIIGCSNPTDALPALQTLRQTLQKSSDSLPYLNQSVIDWNIPRLSLAEKTKWKSMAKKSYRQNTGRDALERGVNFGLVYALTGYTEYAELFLFNFKHYHQLVKATPDGNWEFEHMLFPYAWIWRLVSIWDQIEESPFFSDADRFEMTEILYGLAQYTAQRPYFTDPKSREANIRQNHPAFAALSMYFTGHYFKTYYGTDEFDESLETVRLIMDGQNKSYKPDDDANSYCYLTPFLKLVYDLAHDDFRWIQNGQLREICDYAHITTDSMGSPTTFGDLTRYLPIGWGTPHLRFLLTAGANFYQNGSYMDLFSEMADSNFLIWPSHAGLCSYFTDSVGHYYSNPKDSAKKPVQNIQTAQLTEDAYRFLQDGKDWGNTSGLNIPYAKAFDKIALCGGSKNTDEYLLIDGVSGFCHDHEDSNSIIRLTWKNRMWLTEGDYIRAIPKYHNAIVSVSEGATARMPSAASLEWQYSVNDTVFLQTKLADYNHSDWKRTIIWKKNAYFFFIDTLLPLKKTDYIFKCHWRLLGNVQKKSASILNEQDGVFFKITNADKSHKHLYREPVREIRYPDGPFHEEYPHANDPTKVYCQEQRVSADENIETVNFFNLMTCGTEEEIRQYALKATARNAVRLSEGSHEIEILARNRQDHGKYLQTDADFLILDRQHLQIINCRKVSLGDRTCEFDQPVLLQLHFDRPICHIVASHKTTFKGSLLSTEINASTTVEAGTYQRETTLLSDIEKIAKEINKKKEPFKRTIATGPQTHKSQNKQLHPVTKRATAPGKIINQAYCPSLKRLYFSTTTKGIFFIDGEDHLHGFPSIQGIRKLKTFTHNGKHFLLIGGADHLSLADQLGKILWKKKFSRSHYRAQIINEILVHPMLDKETINILVCTDGWLVHCLSFSGESIWTTQIHHHAAKNMVIGDPDGDGKSEILVGTEYHTSNLLEHDGRIRWTIEGGPDFHALGFCDFNHDGIQECVYGSANGDIYAIDTQTGHRRWKTNIGEDSHTAVFANENDVNFMIAGSQSGEVVRIENEGRKAWRVNLESSVHSIFQNHSSGHMEVFTENGELYSISHDGNPTLIAFFNSEPINIVLSNKNRYNIALKDNTLYSVET